MLSLTSRVPPFQPSPSMNPSSYPWTRSVPLAVASCRALSKCLGARCSHWIPSDRPKLRPTAYRDCQEEMKRLEDLRITEKEELPAKVGAQTQPDSLRRRVPVMPPDSLRSRREERRLAWDATLAVS